MAEMTSKEAAKYLHGLAESAQVTADQFQGNPAHENWQNHAAALRLAVGALKREARRMAAMPWRCQHCALLDVSCFGSNEECNGFEEREHG